MAKVKESPWTWGTGRRKTAVARVRVKSGEGRVLVNGRDLKEYFTKLDDQLTVLAPLKKAGCEKSLDIYVNAEGGGFSGQAGAAALGIARALVRHNPEHEPVLRDGKFLTRDARVKERKKYGRRGARRGFQFSKR